MSSSTASTPTPLITKAEVLARFYEELNKDPSKYTRYGLYPTRKGNHDSPNKGIPWGNLFGAVVGSLAFGMIFGAAGTFFSIGNFPNHHVLDHMQPTKRQMFRFNGRYVMERLKSGKAWVKIGVFFTLADWLFIDFFNAKYPDAHSFASSLGAGSMLGLAKGPTGMAMSALMFGAFTGVFHVASKLVDFDFGPDPYADIDPQKGPPPFAAVQELLSGAPPSQPTSLGGPATPARPLPPMLSGANYM